MTMGSLQDEIRQLNEDRQIELDQKQNARVRSMQLDLAEDVELARAVPDALKALGKEHRVSAREAAQTLEMIDISILTPRQGEMIDTVRNRVRHVLSLLDDGAARATRAVDKVDGLSFAAIKDWSPTEYARCLRSDLRSTSSAPQTIKTIMAALPLDMESIRRMLATGPRLEHQGQAANVEREPVAQTHAHSATQRT